MSDTCAVHRAVRWFISTPVLEYTRACTHTSSSPSQPQHSCRGRGSVAISFFQRRLSTGNSEMPPWWGSTDSTYLQLQGFFSLWLVSMVSMFPIPSLNPVADKGCSCCHYTSSPTYCEKLTGKWNLDAKILTSGTSQLDRMTDIF